MRRLESRAAPVPWYDVVMTHVIRQRIIRAATPEEKQRHDTIREQIKQELPELKQWARAAAARHNERVVVGTVLTPNEAKVVEAIDNYAAKHSLAGRSAVIREALAQLLGIPIARSRTSSSDPSSAPSATS